MTRRDFGTGVFWCLFTVVELHLWDCAREAAGGGAWHGAAGVRR